eukprot:scaffold30647_cov84-Phaeocystis_antarctica.AAC.1
MEATPGRSQRTAWPWRAARTQPPSWCRVATACAATAPSCAAYMHSTARRGPPTRVRCPPLC